MSTPPNNAPQVATDQTATAESSQNNVTPQTGAASVAHSEAYAILTKLAQLRREALDTNALMGILATAPSAPKALLSTLSQQMNLPTPTFYRQPDAGRLPLLCVTAEGRYGIVTAQTPNKQWAVTWWDATKRQYTEAHYASLGSDVLFARVRLATPFAATQSQSMRMVWREFFSNKIALFDIFAGTMAINILALVTSFYSMQVYDRVVPTQATSTLMVLTLGACAAILFELIGKWLRSNQLQYLVDHIDQRLARRVFSHFLSVRLDGLPASVGSTASRLRNYESARNFLFSVTTQLLVDAPLALLMLLVLLAIHPVLALVPLIFMIVGIAFGLVFRRKVEAWATKAMPLQHFKIGLLVESIEGAETIKSGQGGWRMLSKWLDLTDESRFLEQMTRKVSEHSQYIIAMLQQISYVLLVAIGATYIGHSDLTMGGLIAASILAGRVMGPVAQIPSQLIQWAHTKVALQDLDRFLALPSDHPPDVTPIVVDAVKGQFELSQVQYEYAGTTALTLPQLKIKAGERIAILGAIGSGKTTLLRILSGMYKPQKGRVLLDGIDIDLIAKPSLSQFIGFVPQEGRLFAGTLRENLILGLTDPGDPAILALAEKTGLLQTVISPHPKGLAREILEGGIGLSGGQRQLVHVTRALLRNPQLWLLDEPTASMDQASEARIVSMFNQLLQSQRETTFIMVTHKPQLLSLVDRVLVFAQHQLVLDGPRDQVLQKLTGRPMQADNTQRAPHAS